jgi:hypothetical protein
MPAGRIHETPTGSTLPAAIIVYRLPDSVIDTTVGKPYWAFQVPTGLPLAADDRVLPGTGVSVPLGSADGLEAGVPAAGVLPARVKMSGAEEADEKCAVRVLPESVNVVGVQEPNEQLVVCQRPCCPE